MGEYVAILVLLIKRDVPQFVTVFVVIIFSLGGALYLSLIGYYSDDNIDTENNNDTRYTLSGRGLEYDVVTVLVYLTVPSHTTVLFQKWL